MQTDGRENKTIQQKYDNFPNRERLLAIARVETMSGECQPRKIPPATTASTPEACRRSAGKYARNGVSNEMVICTGGSSKCRCTHLITTPTNKPNPIPPAAAQTKRHEAWPNENWPVICAATANCNATSAAASFTRLSPSKMLTIRCGTGRRRVTFVAATASGGETIAPSENAAAQVSDGMSECATNDEDDRKKN